MYNTSYTPPTSTTTGGGWGRGGPGRPGSYMHEVQFSIREGSDAKKLIGKPLCSLRQDLMAPRPEGLRAAPKQGFLERSSTFNGTTWQFSAWILSFFSTPRGDWKRYGSYIQIPLLSKTCWNAAICFIPLLSTSCTATLHFISSAN